jgi:hypothetical protein
MATEARRHNRRNDKHPFVPADRILSNLADFASWPQVSSMRQPTLDVDSDDPTVDGLVDFTPL